MKKVLNVLVLVGIAWSSVSLATGLATCDSGSQDTWKSQDELKAQLVKEGWEIRRVKIDGGCYEVYALNEKGERVEAYFHPQTLEPVATDK